MSQGSILGPSLFLIYVNDIYISSNALQYILFEYDTNAFCSNSDFQILIRNIHAELPKLSIQASKKNSNGSDYLQFLSNPCDKSFFFTPSNCVEMLNIVNSLKISYSCSHDAMSTHFLKQIAGSIVTLLVHICNLSLTTGVFTDSLKVAKVIPIYKKDDSSLVSNYRPVSILPNISKVLERLMYSRLYDFLTKKK